MGLKHASLKALVFALGLTGFSALAEPLTLISSNKDWYVYSYQQAGATVCFTHTVSVGAGDSYLQVISRPSEGVTDELSLNISQPLQMEGASITVNGKSFELVTQDTGAWLANTAESDKVIEAIRAGKDIKFNGVSASGVAIAENFSLSGSSAALKELANCK